MPPNSQLSRFLRKKTGTVLSTRNVVWASNIPKMRWRPGLRPGSRWGAHDGAHDWDTPPNPHLLGAFGASILVPSSLSFCGSQCKILATPCVVKTIVLIVLCMNTVSFFKVLSQ